ncbi:hypothetical protein IWQ60_000162 [Tieghemiomyces parasiticus]|uniref:AB hydrolase-1 domain-containing protein n=1 Tax=Tieghemiomyces parasiticus TaxID=78921 RepID=A0A9W8E3N6_9FUNG|nr:hypothetical protein IWQ60_000162 [Tieghemiomyces parasiticus]
MLSRGPDPAETGQPSRGLSTVGKEAEQPLAHLPTPLLSDTLVHQAYFTIPTHSDECASEFRLYYEHHGRGPRRLVFVGGLGMSLVGWEHQIRHFAALPEYQVLVLDNRGAGWSDTPPGLYTTKAMARDVLALLDHVGWTTEVHLVGFSLGGMVAQEMALESNLDRFATLTFVSTTTGRRFFPPATSYLNARLMVTRDPRQKLQILNQLLYPETWLQDPYSGPADPNYPAHQVRSNRDFVAQCTLRQGAHTRSPTVWGSMAQFSASLRHSMSAARLKPLRDQSHIRCLVLTGTADRMIPSADSLQLASLLRAPIYTFPGSGHVLFFEQARRFNSILALHFDGESVVDM